MFEQTRAGHAYVRNVGGSLLELTPNGRSGRERMFRGFGFAVSLRWLCPPQPHGNRKRMLCVDGSAPLC